MIHQCHSCFRVITSPTCEKCEATKSVSRGVLYSPRPRSHKKKKKAGKFSDINGYKREQISSMKEKVNSQRKSEQATYERKTGRQIY